MALIDTSYFVGEIKIPNIASSINTYNRYIDIFEKEILMKLLGYSLYNELMTAVASPDPLPEKFDKLVNGAEFSFRFDGTDVTDYWPGLVNSSKESLIAYYCYYKIRNHELSTTTSTGEVKGKKTNSEHVNDSRKILKAYRNFLRMYGETRYSVAGVYMDASINWMYFDRHATTYDSYNDNPSAYNFLNSMKATGFTNWRFTPMPNMNLFGL